ncbi:hypothetical protein CORMATOL_03135 [Corynebacterium matruchotii ATCC 33806]|uniref:Uncharacterized protein n=1 Tax=Corynebacterium matruchotii ATCC 33806 TaxID=566549 RepID=C0E7Z4_9CORY|nr:hypothetical protein CORMATOL_03135 [Corynebacterium matruchotii ATCC 33806]
MGEEQCQEWGVVPKLPNAGEFVVFLGVKMRLAMLSMLITSPDMFCGLA